MGAEPVVVAARTDSIRVCPRCEQKFEMPEKRRGPRPVWCSPRCRRLASAERLAARNAGVAVRVVEVPRAHLHDPDARLALPSMNTLARLFLSSDYQCQSLLEILEHRHAAGTLSGQLQAVVQRFAASVHRHQTLRDDPAYQHAHADIERLRERLRRDADQAQSRDHELARLRQEAAEIWSLRARVAELEAALEGGVGASYQPEPRGEQQAALSRQQRRAAQRAARKTH
jgi:hypothetical protein